MSNVFKPKRSSVVGAVPTTSNLADGELAINAADQKVYQRIGMAIKLVANYFSGAWADITGKPTTVAGYGITDAVISKSPPSGDWNTWIDDDKAIFFNEINGAANQPSSGVNWTGLNLPGINANNATQIAVSANNPNPSIHFRARSGGTTGTWREIWHDGNRTLSADPKWAFLCVVRTADIIADSLTAAHLWAVDRGITKTYVNDVVEGVNAYMRYLTNIGAILGGECWADPDLNTPDQIAQGKIFFDFDFTPVYPAEHITFRSHLVNDYIKEIFA